MRWLIVFALSCCLTLAWANTTPDFTNAVRTEPQKPPLTCGDYLKQLGREHSKAKFVGCKKITGNGQLDPGFEAEYRIQGKHAERVESWLDGWAHTGHLRFVCCQWETDLGYFKDARGAYYDVRMAAEAYVNGTMVVRRSEFSKLPYLTLRVTHYLYSP